MNLDDYDLDVINSLKDFPENDEDCYIFIRSHTDDDGTVCHINVLGNEEPLIFGIVSMMSEDLNKVTIFNSVLSYFGDHQDEIAAFQGHLEGLKD